MKHQSITKPTTILLTSLFLVAVLFGTISCNNNNGSIPEEGSSMNAEPIETHESPDSTLTKTELAAVDADFLKEVSKANYHEISLGKLAVNKTKTSHVVELGQMMIDEHTKAQGDVSALAGKKSVMLDPALPDDQQEDYLKLSKTSGKMFDKDYSSAMVDGHKKVISKFEEYVKNAKDENVKAWATATIPTLKMHLQHAEESKKKSM